MFLKRISIHFINLEKDKENSSFSLPIYFSIIHNWQQKIRDVCEKVGNRADSAQNKSRRKHAAHLIRPLCPFF